MELGAFAHYNAAFISSASEFGSNDDKRLPLHAIQNSYTFMVDNKAVLNTVRYFVIY